MKLWKVLGYCFAVLGALVFCYGFTVAFIDMLNPAAIWSAAESGMPVDFFSGFSSKVAAWTILAVALFITGGIGLYLGRNPKQDKRSDNQRIVELENSLAAVSSRLDEMERKQNGSVG
jgi:uncharacterized membrane protein